MSIDHRTFRVVDHRDPVAGLPSLSGYYSAAEVASLFRDHLPDNTPPAEVVAHVLVEYRPGHRRIVVTEEIRWYRVTSSWAEPGRTVTSTEGQVGRAGLFDHIAEAVDGLPEGVTDLTVAIELLPF